MYVLNLMPLSLLYDIITMHVKYLHTHTFLCVYVPKNRTHVLYITTCHKNVTYQPDGYGARGITDKRGARNNVDKGIISNCINSNYITISIDLSIYYIDDMSAFIF